MCHQNDPCSRSGDGYSSGIGLRGVGSRLREGRFRRLPQTSSNCIGSWAAGGRNAYISRSGGELPCLFISPFFWLVHGLQWRAQTLAPQFLGWVGSGASRASWSVASGSEWPVLFTLSLSLGLKHDPVLCVLWQQRGWGALYWTVFPQNSSERAYV